MAKHTTSAVISAVTGVAFIFAGVRDLVAPGFLSIARHTSSPPETTILVLVGVVFLIYSGIAIRQRKRTATQS